MSAPQPAPFVHTELLPLGPDTTEYRLLGTDGIDTFTTPHGEFLRVDPSAITLLTRKRWLLGAVLGSTGLGIAVGVMGYLHL